MISSNIALVMTKPWKFIHKSLQISRKKHHLILDSSKLSPRVLIVGDIHGCLDEFKELLEKCHIQSEPTTIILAGDLVNKGPYSVETIQFARKIGAYCVKGNHDVAALLEFEKPFTQRKSKYSYLQKLSKEDFDWLDSLPYTISLPSHNSLVVHAGIVPGVELENQIPDQMTRMRNLVPLSPTESSPSSHTKYITHEVEGEGKGQSWASLYEGPVHVYFGHDAKRGLQREKHATGLDTGCVYGRCLSGILLPAKELVQVKAHKVYEKPKGED